MTNDQKHSQLLRKARKSIENARKSRTQGGNNLELAESYIDLSKLRNIDISKDITRRLLLQEEGDHSLFWVTGYPGCGKSMELRWIQHLLKKDYAVIYVDVEKELDINHISYTDLYVIIFNKVESFIRNLGLSIEASLRVRLETWFQDIVKEIEGTTCSSIQLGASLEVGSKLPFLASLLAKVNSQISRETKRKYRATEVIESNILSLEILINELLDDALFKISSSMNFPKGFLIIFDQLENISIEKSEHLFSDYVNYFERLHCNIIFTASVEAMYSARRAHALFNEIYFIPAVNIYELSVQGEVVASKAKLFILSELVGKYIDIDGIFDDQSDLNKLLFASGGCLKQLMVLIEESINSALNNGECRIQRKSVADSMRRSANKLNRHRMVDDAFYSFLKEVYERRQILDSDGMGQEALKKLFAFEYLDEDGYSRWGYINPLMFFVKEFKKILS